MPFKFAIRSSSGMTAYVSHNGSHYSTHYKGTTAPATTTPGGTTGVFGGGQLIDLSGTAGASYRGLQYMGLKNVGPLNPGLSVRTRIVPKWSGNPAAKQPLFFLGALGPSILSSLELYIETNGALYLVYYSSAGQLVISNAIATACTFTANTATDLQLSWDGTEGTGKFIASQNGVVLGNWSLPVGAGPASGKFDYAQIGQLMIGTGWAAVTANYYLNEFLVADYALPTTYTARTDYESVTAFDAYKTDTITAGDLKHDVARYVNGVQVTGTYDGSDRWACPAASAILVGASGMNNGTVVNGTVALPSASQVKHEVAFGAGAGTSGTYRGYDLWTAVDAEDIYLGQEYLQDGVHTIGLLDEPPIEVVKHGVAYYLGERVGTYRGQDLWTDPGVGNVSVGTSYLADGVEQEGTREVVTNVLAEATLTASDQTAILKAD